MENKKQTSKISKTDRNNNMFRQAREIKEAANTTTVEDGIEVYSWSLNNKKGNGGIENPPQIDQNLDVINKTEILQENKPPEIIKEYDDAKVLTTPKIVQVKPAQNMKSEREVSPIITTFDLRKYKNATPVVSSKPINNDYDSNYSTSFAKHLERQEKEKERRRVIHMRKERMNIRQVYILIW